MQRLGAQVRLIGERDDCYRRAREINQAPAPERAAAALGLSTTLTLDRGILRGGADGCTGVLLDLEPGRWHLQIESGERRITGVAGPGRAA